MCMRNYDPVKIFTTFPITWGDDDGDGTNGMHFHNPLDGTGCNTKERRRFCGDHDYFIRKETCS